MGRHRKASNSKVRRNSVIALAGLVPAGLVTAATSAGATEYIPFVTAKTAPAAQESNSVVETPQPIAQDQQAQPVAQAELPTNLAVSPIAIPVVNVSAYKNAERILAQQQPGCGISWTVIAGIGRVESTHANNGKVDDSGELHEPILGPVLNGTLAGNQVIRDTDGGALDGDTQYDRAVGPMQFLPSTWNLYHADGNGDGVSDPQNLYDAALATGMYLCDDGTNARDLASTTRAILRYNNSMAYVANVLAWSAGYATGIVPSSDQLPRIH
ncbi:murein transglycosylase [Rhodococcus fascians]|nr:murein transglycosylase [Rhodococcus fascians]MBY4436391.1 murein transglycosylase [Rhodococcus fascians]MBY4466141.1 murein transglycosylase [Rhodococcus fascians]